MAKAKARKYPYAAIMNGNECWAGMNGPIGKRLDDSQCNAKCTILKDDKGLKEDLSRTNLKDDTVYHCGGQNKVSVYRVTIPDAPPNTMAKMILDDTVCKSSKKLDNSPHLWDCARKVRENTANGGQCYGGGGYFNWEAQNANAGGCSCCVNYSEFVLKKDNAFEHSNDTNLYKIEHC